MLIWLKWLFGVLDRIGMLDKAAEILEDQRTKKNKEVDSAVDKSKAGDSSDLERLANQLPDAETRNSGQYHQS